MLFYCLFFLLKMFRELFVGQIVVIESWVMHILGDDFYAKGIYCVCIGIVKSDGWVRFFDYFLKIKIFTAHFIVRIVVIESRVIHTGCPFLCERNLQSGFYFFNGRETFRRRVVFFFHCHGRILCEDGEQVIRTGIRRTIDTTTQTFNHPAIIYQHS